MMGPGEVLIALIVIGLPLLCSFLVFRSWTKTKEKRLDADAGLTAQKSAQNASRTHELEQRVRVLEQIVTDGGLQTAAQIEALRDPHRIESGERVK